MRADLSFGKPIPHRIPDLESVGSNGNLDPSNIIESGTGAEVAVAYSFGEAIMLAEALRVCSSFHGRQCTTMHQTMSSHSSCRAALREQTLGSSFLTTSNDSGASIGAAKDEWAAMPQQLIDTLILSMGRRCENRLAVVGDHIPY
ncbi:hypothetical protein TNCV_1305361 [Trichonephila clavipes]|nr:hypothetical protein TNCV_1305361 [Trichonephila clavipes]